MKETNDKIVQEYIERANSIKSRVRHCLTVTDSDLFEIAKMIQIQDIHTNDYTMPEWLKVDKNK